MEDDVQAKICKSIYEIYLLVKDIKNEECAKARDICLKLMDEFCPAMLDD